MGVCLCVCMHVLCDGLTFSNLTMYVFKYPFKSIAVISYRKREIPG